MDVLWICAHCTVFLYDDNRLTKSTWHYLISIAFSPPWYWTGLNQVHSCHFCNCSCPWSSQSNLLLCHVMTITFPSNAVMVVSIFSLSHIWKDRNDKKKSTRERNVGVRSVRSIRFGSVLVSMPFVHFMNHLQLSFWTYAFWFCYCRRCCHRMLSLFRRNKKHNRNKSYMRKCSSFCQF